LTQVLCGQGFTNIKQNDKKYIKPYYKVDSGGFDNY